MCIASPSSPSGPTPDAPPPARAFVYDLTPRFAARETEVIPPPEPYDELADVVAERAAIERLLRGE